ncbi:MAG: hypothetical protein ABI885_14885 [Gammaproteobacteria bacterium]
MTDQDGDGSLRRLLDVQRTLAWTFSALATLGTIWFFVSMTVGSPWLEHPAIGRFGSRAMLVALLMLGSVALCVWIYGRISTDIDRRKAASQADNSW